MESIFKVGFTYKMYFKSAAKIEKYASYFYTTIIKI